MSFAAGAPKSLCQRSTLYLNAQNLFALDSVTIRLPRLRGVYCPRKLVERQRKEVTVTGLDRTKLASQIFLLDFDL